MWCMCSAPNELHRWHGVWCLGYPGDWQKVARCTEACSDNFAVNISFAWSNSLTLTNKSIFQAHIAICGTGRGGEACFLARDLLNKTSERSSVWWRPQSPPVAEWTDSRGRVWPSQHYISVHTAWTFSHCFPSEAVTYRARDCDHLRCEYVSVGEWSHLVIISWCPVVLQIGPSEGS